MELTPQLLTDEIDFRIAVRGYDRHEVDDFLERVAVAVGQLQSQLTKAVARAKAAEARVAELEGAPGTPAAAQPEVTPERESAEAVGKTPTLHEPVETPEVTAPKAPPSAPVPVVGDDEDLNDELRRTLVLAQRTADTAIREAHDEARQIVDQANDEARRNREAAEAAHAKARDEAHSRLVAEIRELESTREAMRDDTVVLERYLGTERARVRETIQVLRRLVDEPQSFRTGTVP
ncbi:MAG TPA: DivIVA domain-containing protein, partial [Acidimicrobiales bacterium]|nr:DivIVA domain-containing protein [Acidimicrobiales bacterium]